MIGSSYPQWYAHDGEIHDSGLQRFVAQLSSLAWFSCCMVTVTYGGLGKHLYDTTYKEVYWLFRVCPFFYLKRRTQLLAKIY